MKYVFKASVWLYPGLAGWHFVSVEKKASAQIQAARVRKKEGIGEGEKLGVILVL